MTLFEGVSLIRGIEIGGTRKRNLFTASEFPFRLPGNPDLQTLLDSIISQCTESYKTVDFNEMPRRYGFEQASSQAPPERLQLAAPRAAVDFESDNDIPRVTNNPRGNKKSTKVAPRVTKDPCVVEGFLSEVGDLLDLFKEHATVQLAFSDKAVDQFPARKHEDVYHGPDDASGRRIGSLSNTGTILSRNASSGASSSFSINLGSGPGSYYVPGPSTIARSSDSRKRTRTEVQGKSSTMAGNEGEASDSVHRDKRVK